MAEIGLIASLVGIIGFSAKLSLSIFQVGDAVSTAGKEMNEIARQLSIFGMVLESMREVLSAKVIYHSKHYERTVGATVKECKKIFKEIEGIIPSGLPSRYGASDSLKGVSLGLRARAKWVYKADRVKKLLHQLENMKLNMSIMLSTLSYAKNVHKARRR
jgi:hypothetical protein